MKTPPKVLIFKKKELSVPFFHNIVLILRAKEKEKMMTTNTHQRSMLLRLCVLVGVAAMMLCSNPAQAQTTYTAFTVKTQEGTWISYALENLKVTFSAATMTVKNNDVEEAYSVSDVYSLLFTDDVAAIQGATDKGTSVLSLQGSEIRLNVKAGTQARVYDANGTLVATARIGQEGVPVYIGSLAPGIYILRAGKESCKVLVK